METFLPSEIARLVLGYLKEENCQETSKTFMRECPHLREYLTLLNEGREFSTEVLGLSLKMILDEYGNMKLSRRTQASPALANLWDRYELMGSQLRQSITPSVNQTSQPPASRLVNNMHTFSRRQGSRNRYSSARTEGVLVVHSEVSVTTASAPANTPRRGTGSNARGSSFPTTLSLLPHTASTPGGVLVCGPDGRGWPLPGRGSQPPSLRGDDDLESVVSVGGMSTWSTCDQIERNAVTDHTVKDEPGNTCFNQTLAVVDPVQLQGSATPTPAKIISPTSRSPLSSTQLTASTPGNFPKKSQQSTGSLVTTDNTGAAQKSSKPSRRIQSKIINGGTDLSPIRALTSTSTTSCHATPVKSRCSGRVTSYDSTTLCNYGTVVTSSSVPVTTCYTATDDLSRNDDVTMWNPVALSKSAGDSIVLNPAMAVDNKTSPFHLFPLGSGDYAASSCNVPSFVSYPLVPDGSVPGGSCRSVPTTSVAFNSCNSSPFTSIASTGFDFVPVTCNMVPVTSCNSVQSHQVTLDSIPVTPCKLDKAQTREAVIPSVTDTLVTLSKRGSCSSFHDNGNGDNADPLVPRTPVRSRRHLSKEFNSPRDRRKKAQPCKRRTSAELSSAPGCNTSASTLSMSHCSGAPPTIESNSAKGELPDLDMNEMLERLISSHSIAEKIAENINHRLTTQNTSRSNPVANTDDLRSSNGPGTTPNAPNKSLSHRSDLAEDSDSNLPPFESNQGQNDRGRRDYHGERNETGVITCESVVPSHSGDNNSSVSEIPGAGNNTTLAVDAGSVVDERSAVALQDCQLERLNRQQSGRPHDETTVSDLSCTSLLSMSNLDQMTDDAIRFVFDQLCNDPNLDSICSMTYHHTEREAVDVSNSIALSNQTSSTVHFSSHVEQLIDCTTVVNHGASTSEIPSSPADVDLHPPDPFAEDPPIPLASTSVGFDTRRRYIQVCFPGEGENPDRIDIVEVIGSGVEISNGQPSPDNRSTIADGSQTLPLVDSGRETASENPMLLSSQDMSSYLQSSTDVASTLADDGSTSVWPSIPDPTTQDSRTITTSSLGYFSDCDVVAPTDLPPDGCERGAVQSVDSSLNARLEMQTIAEHDLVELKTLDAPRSCHEVDQRSDDLSILPSPAKVVSNASASAVESAFCHRREKSVVDYSPSKLTESGWTFDKSKRKKLHSGNSMKTPAVELKLDEKTGTYRVTSCSIEKKKQLGFGVPGKISGTTSSWLIASAVGAEPMLTCDVGQQQLSSSTGGPLSGSIPALKSPDFNADCITISEVPSLRQNLEENSVVARKETRGRNLSTKQFRVLNRSRGPSTPSSKSTGSLTGGTISGPSTPSRGAADPLTSIDVPSTPGRAVVGTVNGSTAVPTVSGVTLGSAGCSGDPVTSNVMTGLPAASGSVIDLSISSCSQSPCGPTESAKVPSIPTDSAVALSIFTRCVVVPAYDTSNMSPRNPCNNATHETSRPNEKSTSKHNSKKAKQTKSKSGLVYFEQNALSDLTENQECFDRSLVSDAILIDSVPEVSSNNPLANAKPRKASHRSKKKDKHVRDSDKNTSGHTDKKRKSHRAHKDKRANKSEKTEHSNPSSHSSRKICEFEKEFKNEQKESLSNVIQITDSSDDDDLPIAHFLKSGVHKDLPSRNTKSNTELVTTTLVAKSTLQETVGANKILGKDKKSDGSILANNSSSTQNSCQGLGQKVKATTEKESKECSAIPLFYTSLSVTTDCSLQPNASHVLNEPVQLNSGEKVDCAMNGSCSVPPNSNVGSEMVPGDCAELCSQKNILTNPALPTKTNWNQFKIPKYQHSSQGRTSASNTDINASASNHSSESVTAKCCKSMEHILYDRWTSKTCTTSVDSLVVTPAKSRSMSIEIPLASTSKSRTKSLSGGSKSIEHILSDIRKTAVGTPGIAPPDSRIRPAKTPTASTSKPRTTSPADSWKTLEPILSDDRTSKTAAETSRVAHPKSRIASSQKTPIAFTSKPRTVSPLTTSSIQRQNKSESISRKSKSPKKSASGKTAKHGSSGRSILLCEAENPSIRKHSRPKPPKTKKTDQAIVSKPPAPSLLSRATKVHETSTYTMSCSTMLSMPSSFDGLIRLAEANRARVSYDDMKPIVSGMETEPSETKALCSVPNPPVAHHPLESGDGRNDDVDIASALLSLSSTFPGDSNFALTPQNVLSTSGNSSAERRVSACVGNSETLLETCDDPRLEDDKRKTDLTDSDLTIVNPRHEKDSPCLPQSEPTCVYDSDTIDLTVAARDFDLDECCTKHLRASSFSSPSIGLVLNIDEGTKTPAASSSPSTSTSACPSVSESNLDEYPSSWPSEEVLKPSRKRNRSTSADSDSRAKKLKIRKKLKGLDISAFLRQLHPPKNTD